jgi:type IV secretory pathway VirB2 component (pilin)
MSTTGNLPTPVKAAPRSLPASSIVAILVALALVALAVVAGHDLAARQGWISGQDSWLTPAVEALDGLTASVAVLVGAAALGVLGLLLAVLSFAPARTSHVRSAARVDGADLDLWVSPAAVAAVARNAADRAPGVVAAETVRVSRRRIRIAVTTQRDAAPVREAATTAAREAVGSLSTARIDVVTKELPR